MKKIILPLFLIISCSTQSQNVGIGIINPEPSALLDISSTSKGFLPPRMSWRQIQSIPNPAAGLLVYDTGIRGLRLYTGKEWVILSEKEKQLTDGPGSFTATTQGGNGTIYPRGIAMGADKSVYVAGSYDYSPTIGPFNLSNAGNQSNIFLAKFDSLGTPVWIKSIGGSSFESATSIAIDVTGNIYIGGFFLNTVDLDPGPSVNSLTATGGYDGFYAKYDNDGDWIWGKKIAGLGDERVTAITTDGTSLYITGWFNGQVNFNPALLTSFGGDDIFIARFQCSTGTIGLSGWAIKMGGAFGDVGLTIEMYGNNIITGGYFESLSNFTGISKLSYGERDGFLSIHTPTGSLVDVYQIGGNGDDVVTAVAEDLATSTIFGAGTFSNTADFDDRPAVALNKTSNGNSDAFIVRIQGGAPIWVRSFGAASSEEIKSISTDAFGNVYAVGKFSGTVSFDLLPLTSTGSGFDAFLLKTNVGGDIEWVQQAGGLSSDAGEDVTVSSNGKFLFASCTIASDGYLTFDKTKVFGRGFYLARYEE